MKTKVIPSKLLDEFRRRSFRGTQEELKAAADPLAEKLGVKGLKLEAFDRTTVLYSAPNGHFLRAGYHIDHDRKEILFENFADVIVDEVSILRENRKDLSQVVGGLLKDNGLEEADQAFDRYLQRKINLRECTEDVLIQPPPPQENIPTEVEIRQNSLRKLVQETLGTAALFETETVVGGISKKFQLPANTMKNAAELAEAKPMESQPSVYQIVIQDLEGITGTEAAPPSVIHNSEDGSPQKVVLPTTDAKKLSQIVSVRRKALIEEVAEARRELKPLSKNRKFVDAVQKVKSLNAVGAAGQIGEAMSEVVTSDTSILYRSIPEIAEEIRKIFEAAQTPNWDEQLCLDIAEGAQKLAAGVYQKTAQKLFEVSSSLFEDSAVSQDKWEAYKDLTTKFLDVIKKAEDKIQSAAQELTDLINRVAPVLKDEGFKKKDPQLNSVGRALEKYTGELKSPTLGKIQEVVNFIRNYITNEAWQLDDQGGLPKEAQPEASGDAEKDPNGLPYRAQILDKLGPYGEPSKLLEEGVVELADRLKVSPKEVAEWLASYKKDHQKATFRQALDALIEAWQLEGEEGALPPEARPENKGTSENDPSGIPYKSFPKGPIGYKKDAESEPVDELKPGDYEEVENLADFLLPDKTKTSAPAISGSGPKEKPTDTTTAPKPKVKEAFQLGEEGEVPPEARPQDEGDEEIDPNAKKPYRTFDKNKKLGPYGEPSKIMSEEE